MRASGVRLLQKGRRHRRTTLRARKLAGELAKTSGRPFYAELRDVLLTELERANAQAGRSAGSCFAAIEVSGLTASVGW